MEKKKLFLLGMLMVLNFAIFAQYQLGHRTITFTDPARSRDIPTEIYYPATTAGDDVPFANGTFPVVVFGHGFVMATASLYQYLWDSIATKGYIMAFPTNESSSLFPPPNHLNFGTDLAFLIDTLLGSNNVASSFLYGKVTNKAALMGHSMGGKAAWIGAHITTKATTIFTIGAAISNPPIGTAVDVLGEYAKYVTMPAVSMGGEFDCVAPPAENQSLLYDTCTSSCKFYILIKGGGHCYFASQAGSGLTKCESGESSSCTANFTITRAQQNEYALKFIIPWLNYQLKNNVADGAAFKTLASTSNLVTSVTNCTSNVGVNQYLSSNLIDIFPNPANESFNLFVEKGNRIDVNIFNLIGSKVYSNNFNSASNSTFTINAESLNKGVYFIEINIDGNKQTKKLIIK
jgi:hypothetical protein